MSSRSRRPPEVVSPDLYLAAHVREALASELCEMGVLVDVDEAGRVHLSGVVDGEARWREVLALVTRLVPGVPELDEVDVVNCVDDDEAAEVVE